jgi:hypothetical protein
VQAFLQEQAKSDPAALMLQASRYPQWPMAEVVQQLQSRQKAESKLPTWLETKGVVFPVPLSVEQSSSEKTAAFKASLAEGKLLIDLTGGFGVDTYYFSKRFDQVIYVEQNTELHKLVSHNYDALQASNIQTINNEAVHFLSSFEKKADWIYLDPARRDAAQQKTVQLEDCEPDITQMLDLLFSKTSNILLKASPMLDIEGALRQLPYVKEVWIVSVDNECKEVLFSMSVGHNEEPELGAVNLSKQEIPQLFRFVKSQELSAAPKLSQPLRYLYEPNASIMKAGAYRSVALRYKLYKLHPNSHLYTSNELISDFPGRVFAIDAVAALDKKKFKAFLPENKANISVRNFPLTVAEIRKKTGIKEGGDIYLIATTDMHGKAVVIIGKPVARS